MTYFKAVQPDGTDFYTGTVQWVPESGIPSEGFAVTHPTSTVWGEAHATHLCASTSPTDCTGFSWPCRLLEVEPASKVHEHDGNKVSALTWRVVRELPATQTLGPQGDAVVALLDGVKRLDTEALASLADARDADPAGLPWTLPLNPAGDSAWYATWEAAQDAARDSAWCAARGAAQDAARDDSRCTARVATKDAASALVVWDLIALAYRNILTEPIRTALPDLWADVTKHLPHN